MGRQLQSRRVISVGARRRTTWAGIHSLTWIALAADALVNAGGFTAAGLVNVPKSTLIRVRGILGIRSDQNAGIEDAMGAMGIAVVTDAALTAGGASLPDPVDDSAGDFWQTWQAFVAPGLAGTSAAATTWQSMYTVDSKAQRKLGDLDAIAIQIKNANVVGGLEFMFSLRFLFLLS